MIFPRDFHLMYESLVPSKLLCSKHCFTVKSLKQNTNIYYLPQSSLERITRHVEQDVFISKAEYFSHSEEKKKISTTQSLCAEKKKEKMC